MLSKVVIDSFHWLESAKLLPTRLFVKAANQFLYKFDVYSSDRFRNRPQVRLKEVFCNHISPTRLSSGNYCL